MTPTRCGGNAGKGNPSAARSSLSRMICLPSMRRTRLVGGPCSMFCHRLQRPRLTVLTRPNLPLQNGSSGSYCLHAATGIPQPAATGHCSHRLEQELLPLCSYRLSTTSGHRPLQPQAFHNHAAAGHFRHKLSMRPHAMYRDRLCSTGGFILLLLQ